jgi:tRNA(Ile2)-agmatinylcytidine synthase
VRQLVPGDEVIAVGSYKKGSINLEKIRIMILATPIASRPPICTTCKKRMTSDGIGKGYKCKKCGARAKDPEIKEISRTLKTGWYEVPPTARRHLAKPLCRGEPGY